MGVFRSLSALSLVSVWTINSSAKAMPGTVETWKEWTCPPPQTSTLSLTSTQYVPVTTTEVDTSTTAITEIRTETVTIYATVVELETTTETTPTTEVLTTPTTLYETETEVSVTPTTIFQTVTETVSTTEIQMTTSPVTLTETVSTTETQTTTSPLTLTATEDLEIYSSTTRLTSLRLCPTRITNPTFTVAVPLPTDWTWGCPPGWLCKPGQIDCDFEVGLPDPNFYCAPNDCIPAEALPRPLLTWDADPTGNSTPITSPGLTVNAIDSYFNMNPTDFGFGYEIFVVDQVLSYTSTSIIPPAAPTLGARQAQTVIPGTCYPWCNNVLLEAQSVGKTPALCEPDSAYRTSLTDCLICVAVHADDNVGNFIQIAPQFQQFMDYCEQTVATVQTVIPQTSTSEGSTFVSDVTTTSVAVVPVTTPTVTPTVTPTPASTVTPAETTIPISTSELPITTTVPVTITSVEGGTTMVGSDLNQITIIMVTDNTTTTMAGSELQDATLVLPGDTTAIITSGIETTIFSSAVIVSTGPVATPDASSVIASEGASTASSPASTFTGGAGAVSPKDGHSWMATFLAGLIALI